MSELLEQGLELDLALTLLLERRCFLHQMFDDLREEEAKDRERHRTLRLEVLLVGGRTRDRSLGCAESSG